MDAQPQCVEAIPLHYPKELKIKNEDDVTTINVNIYKTTGIVVVKSTQGLFEQNFLSIKGRLQLEPNNEQPTTEESDRTPVSDEQQEQRDLPNAEQTKELHSHCYCTDMRERFTALEGELVQLKEITLSLQTIQTSDQSGNNPTAKQKEGDNIRKNCLHFRPK
ncbi:hypothetical protein E1301_Tti023988 [Triplophysa tibetana]|uniref:Uncharacterized protein n=1 Tax=Triplophysa tibetana TaxID=1572043 RepID=A0A5A9MT57_9TELE|nr:hypothetical protein E1301_Tti023988 [Triplophysa tibetana]